MADVEKIKEIFNEVEEKGSIKSNLRARFECNKCKKVKRLRREYWPQIKYEINDSEHKPKKKISCSFFVYDEYEEYVCNMSGIPDDANICGGDHKICILSVEGRKKFIKKINGRPMSKVK